MLSADEAYNKVAESVRDSQASDDEQAIIMSFVNQLWDAADSEARVK